MKYLHTMIRVSNLEQSLDFFINTLGFVEQRRHESEKGRFTLVFVACPESPDAPVELTYNWDPEVYTGGRNFGHLAIGVDHIYDYCTALQRKASPSIVRRVMVAWPSSARQTVFRSRSCKREMPCPLLNLGPAWQIPEAGKYLTTSPSLQRLHQCRAKVAWLRPQLARAPSPSQRN